MLFLVAPILREAWPALFETLRIHDLYNHFPHDWNEFVFEVHDWNSQESLLHILASKLQILPLQEDDLIALQELISRHFRFESLDRASFSP